MNTFCPACGQCLPNRISPDKLSVALKLSGQKRLIMTELSKAGIGVPVLYEKVEAAVYSGQSDGGPLNARECIHQQTHQLRHLLRPLGYAINGVGGKYREGSITLELST